MMPTDRFEQQLPELLTELAEPRTPDYFDDLLGLTARTRQRPAWTLLERWIPMFEIARQPVHAPPIPWRAIGLLVLLSVVLAAGLALIIGALPRVPEPFGLARNGQIAFARDGDIFISDPATGAAHPVIVGPDHDLGPIFSHQGTQFLFLRQGSEPGDRLMVADADGSNVLEVAGSLVATANISWSPDGSTIAFESSIRGVPTITLAAADGTGARALDLRMPATAPAWRPPDGHQLVVRRTGATGDGLYVVDATGTNLRPLVLNSEGMLRGAYDFIGSAWSPDGAQLAFHSIHRQGAGASSFVAARIHIASISPEGVVVSERTLEFDPDAGCECWPRWSPDGRQLLFRHAFQPQGHRAEIEPMVAPLDGSGGGHPVGPIWRDYFLPEEFDRPNAELVGLNTYEGTGIGFEWAPDGTSILAINFRDDSTWVLNPAGGDETRANLGTERTPSWQRLAQ